MFNWVCRRRASVCGQKDFLRDSRRSVCVNGRLILDLLVAPEHTARQSASKPRCSPLMRQNPATGGKPVKSKTLFFSFLLVVSCTACKSSPRPGPQAAAAKLALTLSPLGNRGLNPGYGMVTLTPAPQSGNADCTLVEGQNPPITCVAQYAQGATVRLRVIPNHSIIETLNGCTIMQCEGCGPGESTCQVVMNGDQGVSVVFHRIR